MNFEKKYLKYKYKYLNLKEQVGGNEYKIYKILNIKQSNVGLKAFSKFIQYGRLDQIRIFSAHTHPGLLFMETDFGNEEGLKKETLYYCRKNNLTDEQIKNTDSPYELFTGSYYKLFTEGKVEDVEEEGTLEKIIKELKIELPSYLSY